MNRLTAKLAQGVSRLAFWRKPAAAFPEQPETAAAEASTAAPPEAEPVASVDTAEPQVGRFERLKRRLNLGSKPIAEPPVEPDPAALAEAPARELADENAIEEAAAAPKLSVLARLKTTFRRQTKPETLEADEPIPGAELNRDATAFSEDDESYSDEDTAQPGRIRRVLAALSNKWVWIPGASAMLLVLIGAMALMLLQSAQEKEHLQAELLATQKKLEQTGVAKEVTADADVPAPAPADVPAFAAVGSRTGIDAGDCQVSDKASVTQNLKNCIDSFNRSMAGSR